MYLVCSTKSGRLAVVWWVYNTTAATQEGKKGIHDGMWQLSKKIKYDFQFEAKEK